MLSGWDEGLGLGGMKGWMNLSEGIPGGGMGCVSLYLNIYIYHYEAIIKHPYIMVLYTYS